MMNHLTSDQLDDHVNGLLDSIQEEIVNEHVAECDRCRAEIRNAQALNAGVDALPRDLEPSRDLWPRISEAIEEDSRSRAPVIPLYIKSQQSNTAITSTTTMQWRRTVFLAAAVLLVGLAGFLAGVFNSSDSWGVSWVEGTPRIGTSDLSGTGKLGVGDWLETDAVSRARLDVGTIGELSVEPNTRLRLLQTRPTDHRVALARGTIHATIWAPPRLFFVETPSATAIDLGCAYTLHVDDDGSGFLHVTAGWVALELAGRSSLIPAGAMCETRPGIGPGTPFNDDVTAAFRRSVRDFDSGDDGERALRILLAEAREQDALTLAHLLPRTENAQRESVYDRLAVLAPPPAEVTREGVLRGDAEMMEKWRDEIVWR
jgi:predicted anti-sigma-YlaC factor YlaD